MGLSSGAFLGGMALLSYARYIEPKWLEETYHRVKLSSAGENQTWKGFRIVFLTDFHLGQSGQPLPVLSQAIKRTVELRPDLVILGGDYFRRSINLQILGGLISPLVEARLKVVGVMGNHDYFGRRLDPERIITGLQNMGIKILRNEAIRVNYKGREGWILGIDDFDRGEPDLVWATREFKPGEKPLIVISHNPDFTPCLPYNFTELVVSGHTHGGQINPALKPFREKFNWIKFTRSDHHSNYPQGWYKVNENKLYVSRGLGMSGLRLRFNARPELAIFELV